eukprot:Nk52_evm3s372 gene=Nk52_evmTU3s372
MGMLCDYHNATRLLTCSDGETYERVGRGGGGGPDVPPEMEIVGYIAIIVFLILLSAAVNCMSMSLLSLDYLTARVIATGGSSREKQLVKPILPLVKNDHLLLVTLLIGNALATLTLLVALKEFLPTWVSVPVAALVLVLFAECIPQALCSRYALSIASHLAWLAFLLLVLCYPIAKPISLLLSLMIGKSHGTFYRKAELPELVGMGSKEEGSSNDILYQEQSLSSHEVQIIKGALDLSLKTCRDIMIPLPHAVMVEKRCLANQSLVKKLVKAGFRRFPVYDHERERVVGVLHLSDMVLATDVRNNDSEIIMVDSLASDAVAAGAESSVYEVLDRLLSDDVHMAFIMAPPDAQGERACIGIMTIEDILRNLLKEPLSNVTDPHHIALVETALLRRISSRASYRDLANISAKLLHQAEKKRESVSCFPGSHLGSIQEGPDQSEENLASSSNTRSYSLFEQSGRKSSSSSKTQNENDPLLPK